MLMSMEERHNNDQLNVAYAMKNQFSTSNTAHRISSKDNNGIVFSSTTTMNMNQHNGLKPVTPGAVPHRALTDADIIRNHEIAEQYAKLMTSDKKN
ncbi:MAG: hypothetical protein EZS28_006071 [Streblomastix strix]|uniref:Uncharacterized protein n=1 Tax=Streblomastix strix TaxID=222440 RepID=A0A5J4WV12_9EUKA|nr:MAG: hypothetical protein EZS28_006071 [Streblomastix strix]